MEESCFDVDSDESKTSSRRQSERKQERDSPPLLPLLCGGSRRQRGAARASWCRVRSFERIETGDKEIVRERARVFYSLEELRWGREKKMSRTSLQKFFRFASKKQEKRTKAWRTRCSTAARGPSSRSSRLCSTSTSPSRCVACRNENGSRTTKALKDFRRPSSAALKSSNECPCSLSFSLFLLTQKHRQMTACSLFETCVDCLERLPVSDA